MMNNKVISFLFVSFSFFLFLHPIDSGDFFHHITTGRYIVNNLTLPYNDTFTFTAYGMPWVAHSWGSGVLYFLLYKFFGMNGINIIFAIIGATIIGLLFLIAKKYTTFSAAVYSLLSLTGVFLSLYWPSRPLVWGPFLITVLLLLFTRYAKLRYILPLLFFCWSLLYGASSILGLAIYGLFLLTHKREWTIKNGIVFLLSVIVSCLNGYGLQSLLYGLRGSSYMQAQEWLPIYTFFGKPLLPAATFQILAYFGWFTLVSILFIYIFYNHKNIFKDNIFETILAVGLFAPFISFRYISLVPILSILFILVAVEHLSKDLNKIVSIAISLFAIFLIIIRFTSFPFGFGITNQLPLQQLVDFMRQHKIYGNVYASQDLGSYISWSMPESKVFIDTRDDLFVNTNVFTERDAVLNGNIPITKLLDSYHANIVVGKPNVIYKPLIYNHDWEIIYSKEYFVAIKK